MNGETTQEQQALEKVAEDLGFNPNFFAVHYFADKIGGYPETWPVGSIWESEGRLLYAIACMIRPYVVVEFGTRYGCSTAHILKALDMAGDGMLYTVDNGANGLMDVAKHPRLLPTIMDGIKFAQTWEHIQVDMIFEDGPHSTEFTRDAITIMLPYLRHGGIVCVHDVDHFLVGEQVSEGFRQAVGEFDFVRILPSDCGLGYWKKP